MAQLGTVAIVGVGLIGGSIGLAIRARSLARRVVGIGRTEKTLAEAVGLGAIDAYTNDLRDGAAGADVVVVCTPVTEIVSAVALAARHANPGVLVTDAGSTKRTIVESVERDERARAVFVGAHPIAGSDRKGPSYADAELFVGRACVLTPTLRTPPDRLESARAFWAALGCRIVELDPTAHDEALALTSHLPHAVAAALAATIPSEILGLAAGAYRDGTRVARSDGALWAGIFAANRDPLLRALSRFESELQSFRRALVNDDQTGLHDWWNVARERRTLFDAHESEPANEH